MGFRHCPHRHQPPGSGLGAVAHGWQSSSNVAGTAGCACRCLRSISASSLVEPRRARAPGCASPARLWPWRPERSLRQLLPEFAASGKSAAESSQHFECRFWQSLPQTPRRGALSPYWRSGELPRQPADDSSSRRGGRASERFSNVRAISRRDLAECPNGWILQRRLSAPTIERSSSAVFFSLIASPD